MKVVDCIAAIKQAMAQLRATDTDDKAFERSDKDNPDCGSRDVDLS
ncbi:MAG: hypothetical protein U1F76_17065 [Candidatus Competibacteraceae bacterium]